MNIEERRKHKRFLVLHNIAQPIQLFISSMNISTSIPAILSDLSSGGMGIMSFTPISKDVILHINIDLSGLKLNPIEGKVEWCLNKEETYRIGIQFTKIDKETFLKINSIAQDYYSCEEKIRVSIENVCFKQCLYRNFCAKPLKK